MHPRQRPQSLKLRKVPRPASAQGADIGASHVIDYRLWLATRHSKDFYSRRWLDRRIGRYLDGEEETEGTYR